MWKDLFLIFSKYFERGQKANAITIFLEIIFSVFHKRTYSILQSAVKDDHLMTPSREPLVKAAEIPDYFLEPLFLVPDCDAWIDRLSPNSYYNRWEEGPRIIADTKQV